jgi:hypothetical protein
MNTHVKNVQLEIVWFCDFCTPPLQFLARISWHPARAHLHSDLKLAKKNSTITNSIIFHQLDQLEKNENDKICAPEWTIGPQNCGDHIQ